jgi:DNA-binding NarL/FixJ family response regulator
VENDIRVLVVEDSWEWLGAAAHVLSVTTGFQVVGTVGTVDDAIEAVTRLEPHVALVDVMLAGESGVRVAWLLHARQAATRVVLISSDPPTAAIRDARAVGVPGFLLKGDLSERDALTRAIRRVSRGERVFSPGILARERHADDTARAAQSRFNLTDRELEVIMHLANGLPTSAIARQMQIGEQAIRNYISESGRKLNASGRLEIVVTAIREGIASPTSVSRLTESAGDR